MTVLVHAWFRAVFFYFFENKTEITLLGYFMTWWLIAVAMSALLKVCFVFCVLMGVHVDSYLFWNLSFHIIWPVNYS